MGFRKLNRRSFALGLAATGLLTAAPLWARRVYAEEVMQAGAKKISTLSDGHLVLPLGFSFPDVPEAEVRTLLSRYGIEGDATEPSLNLTLVDEGDRRILFDAGSGPHFMPSAGQLPDAMDAAGIDPTSITDVIFTHAHPDHLWGIVDDFEEVSFPEAAIHFPRAEWDFWSSERAIDTLEESRKPFAVGAQNRMALIEDRVQLFDAGAEVTPGIEAVDTSGHTPGHTSFLIHGDTGNGAIMVIGDALTNQAVSFEKPEWPTGSDQDTEKGIETRKQLLDRLASDNIAIIGYHLPGSGFGRVEKADTGYRFLQG